MKIKTLAVWSLLASTAAACGSSNPASPSFVAPQAFLPAANAQIPYRSQPVNIMVTNGVSTASASPTYTFEVASDAAFGNIVASNAGIPQGTGGQTSVTLATLAGSSTYFWRVRVTTGGVAGPNSSVRAFSIGPQVTVNTPLPWLPAPNTIVGSPTVLTTLNAQTSGPVGAIVYRFQVADSSAFGNIVFDGTVAQQSGTGTGGPQTSITVTTNLKSGATYYWRVQAIDSLDSMTTPFSAINAFQVAVPVLFDHPWTGNVELALRALLASGLGGPDGENGQAVLDQMNALGGIYAGAEFQPHHDGPSGVPTYGFGWFYVAYIPVGNGQNEYQIVEYGAPPPGD
jgi:hypothetical protein